MTDEEYEELKTACKRRGARSVSDFARSQMLVATERKPSEVMAGIADLRLRLERLENLLAASPTCGVGPGGSRS